jgi:Dimethlysulfonioproprionate lyase
MSDDLFENARWLIGAIARGLHRRQGEGIACVLDRLSAQAIGASDFRVPESRTLPVLRHLPQAIGETMLLDADLAAAIVSVEEALQWRQSSSYSDAILGEGFSANYGWAEIIGPRGFFGGDDFLLGLLMLGPHRHYIDHYHPAPELYWPLTSPSRWRMGDGIFEAKPAGTVIWHPSMTMHAMKTEDAPLLAVWCWTEKTLTPARLAGQ